MRAVLTRVAGASVSVDGAVCGRIGRGFLIRTPHRQSLKADIRTARVVKQGQASIQEKMIHFRDELSRRGITTTIRASRGEDIQAACGLLSTRNREKIDTENPGTYTVKHT